MTRIRNYAAHQIGTITRKRQLTLPAQFVQSLGLRAGDKLKVTENGRSFLLAPVKRTKSLAIRCKVMASPPANSYGRTGT